MKVVIGIASDGTEEAGATPRRLHVRFGDVDLGWWKPDPLPGGAELGVEVRTAFVEDAPAECEPTTPSADRLMVSVPLDQDVPPCEYVRFGHAGAVWRVLSSVTVREAGGRVVRYALVPAAPHNVDPLQPLPELPLPPARRR